MIRVNKFEKMAVTAPSIQESKPLWAYKVRAVSICFIQHNYEAFVILFILILLILLDRSGYEGAILKKNI